MQCIRSGKKNFVTQSAISQGIAKLEKVIGVQLVTHSRSNFQLTEEGRIVFEQAGEVFKALQALQDKIQDGKKEITGELLFSCTNSLGMSFILDFRLFYS
jgi:DNA-binding transcriptional LysR family regulator